VDSNERSLLNDDESLIDLRGLLVIFRRRLWSAFAAGFIALITVVVITLQATPLYTSTASIVLNLREQRVVDFEAVLSGMPPDSATVDTEVEILRSRALTSLVVERLDLTAVPEFNGQLREPGFVASIINPIKDLISGLLPGQVEDNALLDDEEIVHEGVVNALMAALTVRRAGLTYVIDISATTQIPRLSRDIADTYADVYIVSQLEAEFAATERANSWLDERVDLLREDVRVREQAVADYRNQEGLIDAGGATVAEQQVSDLNSQLAIQRAELSEAQARLDAVASQIERGVQADTIAEVLRSDVIRELRSQQSIIRSRQADLSSRYGPRHPEILTVARELSDIDQQIDGEIARIVASLENEVNVARQRVRSLQQSLAGARSELAVNNSAIVRLRELEREAEASRALFESFLNRFRQTNESEGLAEADARVIANAAIPSRPSSPNVLLNFALGLVLAGIAAVGAVFLLEIFDNGLRTDNDVESQLGFPHIVSIPLLKSGLRSRISGGKINPYAYTLEKPMSGFAESFRTIQSALRLSNMDEDRKIVAISSAVPGEGKTTTSLCLGRVTAMSGASTIVVDCDLRRRLLSDEAVGEVGVGLLEVLNGDAELSDAIVIDEGSGMHILPLSKTTFSPKNVFGSKSFDQLLSELRVQYDQVILDTAPVLAVSDTREIASKADATIVTALWKKSPASLVRKAIAELVESRARVLGVVLNSVDFAAQAKYGYDNAGYYYKSYRKYYSE